MNILTVIKQTILNPVISGQQGSCLTGRESLRDLLQLYVNRTGKDTFDNISDGLLKNPVIFLPMTPDSNADFQTIVKYKVQGGPVRTRGEKPPMEPDILKSSLGKRILPVFTAREEAAEKYEKKFMWVQFPFWEILKYIQDRDDIDAVGLNVHSQKVIISTTYLRIIARKSAMEAGLLGLAVGESIGIPNRMASNWPWPPFDPQQPPVWGEFTGLTLATMDSIVKTGAPDYNHIMTTFLAWMEDGKYRAPSQARDYVDIDVTTKYSILRFKNGMAPLMCGDNSTNQTGAASLLRILPIVYYLHRRAPAWQDGMELTNRISRLTHDTDLCWLGCCILSNYVDALLLGCSKTEALQVLQFQQEDYRKYYLSESCNAFGRILSGEILTLKIDDIQPSAHIVCTLESAFWCLLNSRSYQEAVESALYLGGMTNYTCAITGALAGIVYGKSGIPKEHIRSSEDRNDLQNRIQQFVKAIWSKTGDPQYSQPEYRKQTGWTP